MPSFVGPFALQFLLAPIGVPIVPPSGERGTWAGAACRYLPVRRGFATCSRLRTDRSS